MFFIFNPLGVTKVTDSFLSWCFGDFPKLTFIMQLMRIISYFKNIVQDKFKENIWCHKELEDKRKLRYYKEVVNPNLEDQKYL
jgi:hypothetical protein